MYVATKDGRRAEIIVSDDFMEIREGGTAAVPDKKERKGTTAEEDVEAEIQKFFLEKVQLAHVGPLCSLLMIFNFFSIWKIHWSFTKLNTRFVAERTTIEQLIAISL